MAFEKGLHAMAISPQSTLNAIEASKIGLRNTTTEHDIAVVLTTIA